MSRKWWVMFPGEVYANDVYFKQPVSERECRRYIRQALLKPMGKDAPARLPRGTEVWK